MLVIRLFTRSCQSTSRALLSFSLKPSPDHIQRRREMQNPVRGNHVHKEEDKPLRITQLAGRWLDLLSGTGSVGIEAISRGCSQVFYFFICVLCC
ncbi:hypothetical protein NC651_036877 [Populus alba x Populus x berolinensis]|nr:hypothetical protein NC651_036877 [Populus alba x Populus x berolinensis]